MSLPDSAGRAIAQQAFLVGALELGLDRAVDHPALTGTFILWRVPTVFPWRAANAPRSNVAATRQDVLARQPHGPGVSLAALLSHAKKIRISVDKTSHRILVYEIY